MRGSTITIEESHERVCAELEGLVRCIRNFELGDFSPLMDEVFDSEHALKKGEAVQKAAHIQSWRDYAPFL